MTRDKMKINKTIKKGIITGLAGLILAGCSTFSLKPTGSVEIAKVPMIIDDQIVENELMTELDIGAKLTIERGLLQSQIPGGLLEGASLTIGGAQRTYMHSPLVSMLMPGGVFYRPNRQEYDMYGELEYKNFTFLYVFTSSIRVNDEETRKEYSLNHDSITKIGFRWEF